MSEGVPILQPLSAHRHELVDGLAIDTSSDVLEGEGGEDLFEEDVSSGLNAGSE
jgi:hypothetical protein